MTGGVIRPPTARVMIPTFLYLTCRYLPAWSYFAELEPDLALLQEINLFPRGIEAGYRVIHQIDHMFLGQRVFSSVKRCHVGDTDRVFGGSLSDHLPIVADSEA